MAFKFHITSRDPKTRARAGLIETPHGIVQTPAFFPVGTLASVKGVTPAGLRETGVEGILANAWHLSERPGTGVVRRMGGIHRFMGWEGAVVTDSGGYQVFSLPKLLAVEEGGLIYRSPVDGAERELTPAGTLEIQKALGSDIAMVLDQPVPYPSDRAASEAALRRTTTWASASRANPLSENAFAIVQGGFYADLRRRSAEELARLDFPGYAVGGLRLGEPLETALAMLAAVMPVLPEDKPRYIMGMGGLRDMAEAVALGADFFDCVLPTRNGRNGMAFTALGTFQIRNARFREDDSPLEPGCPCYACRTFSRGYLRHLFMENEMLGAMMLTLHNLRVYASWMERLRAAIREGRLETILADIRRAWPAEGGSRRESGAEGGKTANQENGK
ncbi:MAG: tRNA guanosine(34) transglycosylase Tgt [Planctomycetota bacterium]